MKENKIFIDNFYDQNLTIGLSLVDTSETSKLITGLHPKIEEKVSKRLTVSEIFKGLLLHDKIVFTTIDLLKIINAFGIVDTTILIRSGKIELIDDKGLSVVLRNQSDKNYELTTITLANENGEIKDSLQWLEKRLWDSKTNNNNNLNTLLLNAENYNSVIDIKPIIENILSETKYDIANSNVVNYLKLTSNSTKEVNQLDIYNTLRLSVLNKSLIYSSKLGIKNIAIDAAVRPILGVKLSPSSQSLISEDLYDSFFQDIFNKKEIPDLADLYLKKIITINDYLEIITSFSSARFRNWIFDKEYNSDALLKDLISMSPKISSKIAKYISWTIPNAIGLIAPATGISASFVSSFIIEKISNGWHPNLFLDDFLKNRIDKKIEIHEKSERMNNIKRRFPNIGRNDICPCGSEKKFKRCCGK